MVLAPQVDLPYSEIIPWEEMIVIFNGVPPPNRRSKKAHKIHQGEPYKIENIMHYLEYYAEDDIRRMKSALNCVWPRLIWDKTYPLFEEVLDLPAMKTDAYQSLVDVLFQRKQVEKFDTAAKFRMADKFYRVRNSKCAA